MRRKGYLSATLLCLNIIVYAQNSVYGYILNQDKKAVPFANIYAKEISKGTVSDINGSFSLSGITTDSVFVQISCIGYESLTVNLPSNIESNIILNAKKITIAEVSVIAIEKKGLETASIIQKDALKHLQPSSFTDILELLPGGISIDNDLTNMQLITIREAKNSNKSNYMSSLGTAFIIDGMPQSNDGNVNNINTISSLTKLSIHERNTAGKGIDMRLIPTDDIEKVEIIRGIPSAQYGDLSSGVVNIKRYIKHSPLYARFKASPKIKQFALNKGFKLKEHQHLTASVQYANYASDPRDIKNTFSRLSSSIRYKNEITNSRQFNLRIDYTGAFDDEKIDPQIDKPVTNKYEAQYGKVSINSDYQLTPYSITILDNVTFRLSGSYTTDKKDIQRIKTGSLAIPLDTDQTGIHDGVYLPTSYIAMLTSDNQPTFFNAQILGNLSIPLLGINHKISVGGDWRYNKNFGKGDKFDPLRPMYTLRMQIVKPNSIPSLQKLVIFTEDNFNFKFKQHELDMMVGIRATKALNLSSEYTMSSKIYFDPRFNFKWTLPKIQVFSQDLTFNLKAGYGLLNKFPALMHLYPPPFYFDIMQLNYGSNNKDIERLNFITYKINSTNFKLEPALNKKIEYGFGLNYGQIEMDFTAFYEKMYSGFTTSNDYHILKYTDYQETSVDHHNLTEPPPLDMFDYEIKEKFETSETWDNGGEIIKQGIEYVINCGYIKPILSNISINGAWFKTRYDKSIAMYKTIDVIIDGKDYPYLPYYNWKHGRTYEQFNTNLRFDTKVESLGLIFSSLIQSIWYTKWQFNKYSNLPLHYLDKQGNTHNYSIKDKDNSVLRHMYRPLSDNMFDMRKEAIDLSLNLKVSKEISKHLKMAFYVNSLLTHLPDYTETTGLVRKRKRIPWFGMEINLNI